MRMKMEILISIIPTLYFVVNSVMAANVTNITDVLNNAGQFTTFVSLLTSTQVANQLQSQLNSSQNGLTIFAPTDNAFQELSPGALNSITQQQKVALLLYHVLPTYYSLSQFQTLSNPLTTQGSDSAGPYKLNVTFVGVNQVNVSTGLVDTPISNTVYSQDPLAVYQVDEVLLPEEIFGPHPTTSLTPPPVAVKGTNTAPPQSAISPSGSTGTSTGTSGSTVAAGPCAQGLFLIVFSCFVPLFMS